MIDSINFLRTLARHDVNFFTGVPDSLLKPFCSCVSDQVAKRQHVIAANEGAAIGLGIGHYLATGQVPCIYLQNSGLGNTINPLLSLAAPEVYAVPMLLIVGWRGEPDVKDEPQHLKQGKVTIKLLDAMGINYTILHANMDELQIQREIEKGVANAKATGNAFVFLIRKATFAPYEMLQDMESELTSDKQERGYISRESAIKSVVEALNSDDVVVSTTGMASRELFELRASRQQSHQTDFLTVGGMGHASQIAMGLAIGKPDARVVCLDGDGAVLMHMGSLAINGAMDAGNFCHIVLNNGAHDSVGGQPTVGFNVDFPALARASGYQVALQAVTEEEIAECMESILENSGPTFLEIRVKKGNRSDIGRPTQSTTENKVSLMEFLK